MYTRPKSDDSEEDLLKQQEEFVRLKSQNKITPAATVSNLTTNESTESSVKQEETQHDIEKQLKEKLANTFEAIPDVLPIGNVVERTQETMNSVSLKFPTKRGFPDVYHQASLAKTKPKFGSLFAQQFKKVKTSSQVESNLPSQSSILTGTDKHDIHEENIRKLREMSDKEILEEREKLIATMDPAIVAFLRSKKATNTHDGLKLPSAAIQNEAAADLKLEEIEASKGLLSDPEADNWLNFDVFEANKLAWMKDVEFNKVKKKEAYEARFDFSGWLLPYSEAEISERTRILYHHGEEPDRPGYTLQELFQLARSTVIQQKITALNTIANILSLNSTGIYENVIELPIEQVFFVLRFCMDENVPGVLSAAVKAMRNLLHQTVDEACLDSLLGFGVYVQPVLSSSREGEDDNTVNDQQLAETDLVKCLVRTNILARIRYIIQTIKPQIEVAIYCIEILIRLARDSDIIVKTILATESLLQNIIHSYIPEVIITANTVPLIQAVKLVRLLAARNKNIALELHKKYKILNVLSNYLCDNKYSQNARGMRLQTECINLLIIYLHYKIGLNEFKNLQPVLITTLVYHVNNTDVNESTTYVRQGHASSLLNLIEVVCEQDKEVAWPYVEVIMQTAMRKWCKQLEELKQPLCGKLQIVASLMRCLSCFKVQEYDFGVSCISSLLKSEMFGFVTGNLSGTSNLLNDVRSLESSSNFVCVEAAAWDCDEHVLPLLNSKSCFQFLTPFSQLIHVIDEEQIKLEFLYHRNIQSYLNRLNQSKTHNLVTNWFTQIESTFVMNILKIAVAVKEQIDTSLYYQLAVKCLSIFNKNVAKDVRFLMENIIFSTKFYPSDVLMRHLNLNEGQNQLESSLSNLDDVLQVYLEILKLDKIEITENKNLVSHVKSGSFIPVDWIYTPILVFYVNQQDNKIFLEEHEQIRIVKNCLRWIYIYELYFPELADLVHVSDRFCRLACTFLGSDSLFLDPEVQTLLQLCLKIMLQRKGGELDFQRKLEGLSNFHDFYIQLLEQFQGVSYGNKLFAQFILIPLAQRHNVQWRKTLWSEYQGIVSIFNLTSDKLMVPFDDFLMPEETDVSLLKCYRQSVMRNHHHKESVLYDIAKHHLDQYCERRKKLLSEQNANPT